MSTELSSVIRRTAELCTRVSLCSEQAIEIGGQVFTPDIDTAFVECYLSHSFPVVTVDDTTLYPQVVADSYQTMRYKVFDLCHLMKKYDPKNNKRDHILGTVLAVEFPPAPEGGWKVQGDKSKAPGIRAVACMHKNAEQVEQILAKHLSGELIWTVSMEQSFRVGDTGFLIAQDKALKEWEESTPQDFLDLGWVYVPMQKAPTQMRDCFDADQAKIVKKYKGLKTLAVLGGLDGHIDYMGIGLTPLGKEKEAEVSRMLASALGSEPSEPELVSVIKKIASLPD